MKLILFLLATAALLVGCSRPDPSLARQGEQAFHAAITNQVVGFSRLIDCSFYARDHHPISWNGRGYVIQTNWLAEATVEFINRQGGIERTNYPFMFILRLSHADDGSAETNIEVKIDDGEIFRRQMRALGSTNY